MPLPDELLRAAIIAAHQREQDALAAAATARDDGTGYIVQAIEDGALSVIEIAAMLDVTRKAVYKRVDRYRAEQDIAARLVDERL